MSVLSILSIDNPVFKGYIFYGSILVVKMMAMSLLTASQRHKHKAFANPEDAKSAKVKATIVEDVERVRRAHLNDLENIPIFFVAAFGYTLTDPPVATALLLFRIYTAARFVHTVVYAVHVVRQPARAIAFGVGYLITGYLAAKTILHFY